MSINYNKLTEEMPHKIKVQTASEYGCNCVAYVDARQVQHKLDDVVGPNNWQTKYESIDGQLFCHLGIYDADKKEWIWKSDTGSESMAEKEKGLVSDAFKRSAVQWGIGRFLYSLGIKKTKSVKDNRGKWQPAVTQGGTRIWDLTKHFKSDQVKAPVQSKPKQQTPAKSAPVTGDSYVPTPGRYNKEKGGADVKYDKSSSISPEIMARIRDLNRDGKTGKDVLVSYIEPYNASKGTKFIPNNLTTNAIIKPILDFIDEQAPSF